MTAIGSTAIFASTEQGGLTPSYWGLGCGPTYRVGFPWNTNGMGRTYSAMIRDLRAWTGWSSQQLATILDASHRIDGVYDVVKRVFILAGSDPDETVRILSTAPGDGPSAVDALRNGNPERAYLSAIDVHRPRPTGLLVSNRPRRGDATTALHD